MLHAFVKIDTWGSLSCYMYLSKLLNGFVKLAKGCLKKLSFTKLNFWRSCFQLGRNTYDICDKSGNAQFGKTQFFLRHPVSLSGIFFGTPCSSQECLKNSTKTFFPVASVLERVSNSFVCSKKMINTFYLTLMSQYQ